MWLEYARMSILKVTGGEVCVTLLLPSSIPQLLRLGLQNPDMCIIWLPRKLARFSQFEAERS